MSAVATRHAHLVGEMVWAWNELQHAFCLVFIQLVTHPANPIFGREIWNAVVNDRAQRDLLQAAVDSIYSERARLRTKLTWAITSSNDLATYRNDLIHSPMAYLYTADGLTTSPSTLSVPFRRFLRLHSIRVTDLMRRMRGDLLALSEFVASIFGEIAAQADDRPRRASPRRPAHAPCDCFGASRLHVANAGKSQRCDPRRNHLLRNLAFVYAGTSATACHPPVLLALTRDHQAIARVARCRKPSN